MMKHNCREAQRKAEQETDARRKTEALLGETKKRLDDEQNKRTREMNNNQQHNDKINALEKQLADMQEKYKTETEASQKYKKQLAELRLGRTEAEAKAADLQSVLAGLQAQRDVLQQEVADTQARLAQERNLRAQSVEVQKELDVKLVSVGAELERCVGREQQTLSENGVLIERISVLEKENASVGLELKSVQSRFEQEALAHQQTEQSKLMSRDEANVQEVSS